MTEPMLKDCAKEMCVLLECAETNPFQAVRKKFSQLKHHSVAKINFMAAPGCQAGEQGKPAGVLSARDRRISTAGRRSGGGLPGPMEVG